MLNIANSTIVSLTLMYAIFI